MHGIKDVTIDSTRPESAGDQVDPSASARTGAGRAPLPVRPPHRAGTPEADLGIFATRTDLPEVETARTSRPVTPAAGTPAIADHPTGHPEHVLGHAEHVIDLADLAEVDESRFEQPADADQPPARPPYALEVDAQPDEPPSRSVRARQIALVLLMAMTGSLIVVLPEPSDDFALESAEPSTSVTVAPSNAGVGRLSDDQAEAAPGADGVETELALAPTSVAPVPPEPQLDLADAAAMAAAALPSPTEQEPEATTTTVEPAPETTEAPTTTAAPAVGQDDATESETTDPAADTTEAPSATQAPTGDEDQPEAVDGGETPTTTAPAPDPEPTTTEAEGEPGWVDAGHGVLVPPVLLAIRWCESRDDYTAANPSSSARGAYQFLTGSWDAYGHKDRYGVDRAHLATPAQQDEAALLTWERDGTRPWNASKSCWQSRI
ncbi:MAG: transglycosylase family protein [Actinomycetota bacterium]